MSELLVKFDEAISSPDGRKYFAHAAGNETESGLWEGWLGEHILRSELSALSREQVETIATAYGFTPPRQPGDGNANGRDLVDAVVNGVRSAEARQ